MTIRTYLIAILCVLLVFIGSCNRSFLDLEPYTLVQTSAAIKTEGDLLAALNGCYAQLASPNLFGRSLPLIGDLASDNTYLSTRNSGKYLSFDQNLITTNNIEYKGIWFDAYTAILRANNVINSKFAINPTVRQYKGEAFALRALIYFTLVKTFCKPFTNDPLTPGVPLVLNYNPYASPRRNSIIEVHNQIIADLDSAARLISLDNGSARFSKISVAALAAKISLYQKDYKKAFSLAKGVIENEQYTLLSRSNFLAYWAASNPNKFNEKGETLFEVSAVESSNSGSDLLSYMYRQDGYGDLLAAKSLVELYSQTDIRRQLILRGKREAAENPAFIINKYTHLTTNKDGQKIIRLSEIYLIAAESAFRLRQEEKAIYYLNKLMSERDPNLQYISSGNTLLEDIFLERRKELAFEGDRFHDLNRLNKEINKKDGQFQTTIPFGHPFRIAPIPEAEINANPYIIQNEGY